MQIIRNRRHFLASLALAGATGLLGTWRPLAAEGPAETITVRLAKQFGTCIAPQALAEELLRAEGFTDVHYVSGDFAPAKMVGLGEIDFGLSYAASVVSHQDAGWPVMVLAGVHSGCFELFAHEPISTVSDLKGRKVGLWGALDLSDHLYLALMVAHVGLDPQQDIDWVTSPTGNYMELFVERKVDAFLASSPEPEELRARNIGRAILNTTTDRPWSHYFCCMVAGNPRYVRKYPEATKRVLRAILKAADLCAADPERVARRLVDHGYATNYDHALQSLKDLPYRTWREFDPEDTMRFYALRLHEVRMITSSPNQLIAEGTDWRFLNEIKRELKV